MGAVLPAVALYIFVSMFSAGAESDARWKILGIAFGSALVSLVCQALLPGLAGVIVGVAAALALIAAALILWCHIDRKAAWKIVGAYLAFCIVLTVVLDILGAFVQRS